MADNIMGGIMNIPDSLLPKLDEIDKKLERIAEASDNTSKTMVSAFNEMKNGGTSLLELLVNIAKKASDLGDSSSNVDKLGSSLQRASSDAQNMASSVTQAADNLNKIGTGTTPTTHLEQLKAQLLDIDSEFNRLRESQKAFDESGKLTTAARGLASERSAISEEINLYSQSADKIANSEDRKAASAEKAANRQAAAAQKAAAEAEKAAERERQANLSTYSGATEFASGATSINERTQAIKYLTAARANLSTTDADYNNKLQTLNSSIKQMNAENQQAIAGSKELANSHSRLLDTTSQLARQLALLFSVSAIKGYIGKLVEARAMFEMQQVSLEAILQNKSQADEIFQKTVNLAINSPFRIRELVTYTKELAAYRVESEKLYDTTKMLADVSAGLGVDMDRLILAYGQVKAAAYLRGQEVRQFTEAGINIYGELASYYKDVKGEAYTTGQIVDMISKRMVTFSDVEQVFKRLTSEGGIFYNMQEIQANTLQGKISNLKDSFDVMFNSIGKANEGMLKGGVDATKLLLDNWETLVNVGKTLAAVLLLLKVRSMELGVSFTKYITVEELAGTVTKGTSALNILSLGFGKTVNAIKTFGLALKGAFLSNIYLIAITAVISAIYELYNAHEEYINELKKIDEETDKARAKITNLSIEYDKLSNSVKNVKIGVSVQTDDSNIDAKKKEIQKLLDLYKEQGLEIPIKISDINTSNVDKTFEYLKKRYIDFLNFTADIQRAIAKNNDRTSVGGIFGENIDRDMEDLSSSIEEVRSHASDMQKALYIVGDNYDNLTESAKKWYDTVKEGQKDNETQVEYLGRLNTALLKITKTSADYGEQGYVVGWARDVNTISGRFFIDWSNYQTQLKEGQQEWMTVINSLKSEYPNWQTMSKFDLKVAIDKAYNEQQWDEASKDAAKKFAYTQFKINITADKSSVDDSISEVDKQLTDYFNRKKFKITISVSSMTSDTQAGSLNETLDKSIKTVKQLRSEIKQASSAREELVRGKSNAQLIKEDKQRLQELTQTITDYGRANDLVDKSQNAANKRAKNAAAKEQRDILSEQISLLKEMNTQYESYIKNESKQDAIKKVFKNYALMLSYVKIPKSIIDSFVPTKEGLIAALEKLLPYIKDFKKKVDLNKEIANIKLNIDTENAEKVAQKFKDDLQKSLDSLSLNQKLLDLGISQSEINTMFGNLTTSLDKVDSQIAEMYKKAKGETEINAVKEYEKKVAQMRIDQEYKTFEELSKAYKNKLADQLQIDMWYAEERSKIMSNPELAKSPDLQSEYMANLQKQYETKTSENQWKEFQNSDFYIKIFEDLDYTSTRVLDKMKEKLEGLKTSLNTLSPEQLKQITEQENKIGERLNTRNPFKNISKNLKEYIKLQKDSKKIDESFIKSSEKEDYLKEEVRSQGMQVEFAKKRYDKVVAIYGVNSLQAQQAKFDLDIQQKKFNSVDEEYKKTQETTKELSKQIRKRDELKKKITESIQAIGGKISQVASIGNGITDMLGSWGIEVSDDVKQTLSGIDKIGSSLASIDISKPFSTITGTIGVITGIGKTIGGIFGFGNGDKKKQKEIERQQELVKRLSLAYENLKTSIDEAYSTEQLTKFNDEAQKNIDAQIAAYQSMIAAEERKKKTDQSKIEEWQNDIRELEKTKKELAASEIEKLGGFGSIENVKSAAEEFVSAWLDAFNETGDGLDALNSKMNDFIKNAILKQLQLKITEKYIKPITDQLDSMLSEKSSGGATLTPDEAAKWMKQAGIMTNSLNDYMKKYMDAMKLAGLDISSSSSNLSQLQQGIQSVTESTAEALQSLLNSIRFFSAQQTTDISEIKSLLKSYLAAHSNEGSNMILVELQAQTKLISSINNMFDSVRAPGFHSGGYGLKVIM